ncbi:universal stress protein [Thalassococcus lentus]|uniref:Universal stress protein n=1 Tax=Thalassococcus lentus TaxID=1210524 RepID=A0ABT4XUU6_9RHOB|nr:universal stress protein [Thalassococcus lentus]MDA7425730.1 universal stress protein [Thalassococcus lentus]
MFNKILLAIDLNEPKGAARAAAAVQRMVGQEPAEVHVINVVPDMGMAIVGAAFAADHSKTMKREVGEALAEWAKDALPGLEPTLHVQQGTIYDMILRSANDLDVDAIVVGAHRPELRDYLMGPNAARVVRHARQSVFVVR